MMRGKIACTCMRVALGMVFLLFGIGKFKNDVWAQTIKNTDFFLKLPWDATISVFLIGASEIITGIALIVGICTRFFAGVASLQLAGILLLLRFEETRDIGLLGAAIYLAAVKNESYGIDLFLSKKKRRME